MSTVAVIVIAVVVVLLIVAAIALLTPRSRARRAERARERALTIGVVLAPMHHYFAHADALKAIVSAVLAIILWPLLLLGVNRHVH
jgi:tetrahydromethanopterin S-methyltransferase subunit C